MIKLVLSSGILINIMIIAIYYMDLIDKAKLMKNLSSECNRRVFSIAPTISLYVHWLETYANIEMCLSLIYVIETNFNELNCNVCNLLVVLTLLSNVLKLYCVHIPFQQRIIKTFYAFPEFYLGLGQNPLKTLKSLEVLTESFALETNSLLIKCINLKSGNIITFYPFPRYLLGFHLEIKMLALLL
ncbi:hypothetical protein AGLY_015079 [Aphis glycines]|uniref:Uncharacterized protein n=1 Tax=Aphis glycines TaxID=307491 RepID=A0A6G0T3J3_APHGL|nr:hypothetical protein AGLY_015079 [Aphis glycines]